MVHSLRSNAFPGHTGGGQTRAFGWGGLPASAKFSGNGMLTVAAPGTAVRLDPVQQGC